MTNKPDCAWLLSDIESIPKNNLKVMSTFACGGGSSMGYKRAGCTVVAANDIDPEMAWHYQYNLHPPRYYLCPIRDLLTAQLPDELFALDILDGSPPCFAAGTMILTRRGLVPIEDVHEGDMVVTHRGRWRKVTGTTRKEAHIVSVRGHGHPGIATTLNHSFYVRHQTYVWNYERGSYIRGLEQPVWKDIGECLPNEMRGHKGEAWFWGMLRRYPEDIIPEIRRCNVRSAEIELNSDVFWIVGLWLGDGWLRAGRVSMKSNASRGEVLICAGKHEAHIVRDRMVRSKLPFSEAEMRTTIRFTICHKGFAEWLEEDFGRGAKGKTVPYWAFGMAEELRQAILDGYIFADGHGETDTKFTACSVSWSLILGISMIARTLGIATSVRCITRENNNQIENRTVNVAGAVYTIAGYDKPRSFIIEEDYCWARIKKIADQDRGTVYNIHVEEDESYVADGLIVHNCSTFSMAGSREKTWGKEKHFREGQAKQVLSDLFFDYLDMVERLKPKVAIAENVKGMLIGNAKGYTKLIMARFKEIGYRPQLFLLNAADCGVPQKRERVFFCALRNDLDRPLLKLAPSHRWISAGEATRDIQELTAEEMDDTENTPLQVKFWKLTKPGSNFSDAVESVTGKSSWFNNVRMHKDQPAFTLSSQPHKYHHWNQPRFFSYREWKRLGSFPDDYHAKTDKIGKYMIGMSVPPKMTEAVARAVIDQWLLPS